MPPSTIGARRHPSAKQKSRQVWRMERSFLGRIDWNGSQVRMLMVCGFLGLGLVGLVARLFYLQVLNGAELQKRAQNQQSVSVRPFVPRRPIVDRHQNPIAIDRPSYTIYAHPKLFKQNRTPLAPVDVAKLLAPILDRSPQDLTTLLQKRPTGIKLGQGLREDIKERIQALKIDGLEITHGERDYTRLYPQAEMAAEVLGYLDRSHEPQAGVEYSQSSLLEREVSQYHLSRTATGAILPDRVTPNFLHNEDLQLQLTIDLRLQRAARRALKAKMREWGALRGTVIVMDAQTGALRSLVVEPTYDPNNYSQYIRSKQDLWILKNWAVQDLYEPGSTFKPINLAIALEEKAITPQSTFNDRGLITIDTHQIRNSDKKAHGVVNIQQGLQYSSNIVMVEIIQRIRADVYYSWLQRMGLGQRSGIDLPFEARSEIKGRQEFLNKRIEPATAAFGQGLAVTPIQLAALIASLANGGKLVTPYVVEGLFDSKGTRFDRPTRPAPVQIFSSQNTEEVVKLMEGVVNGGTGDRAKIDNYRIAGKTGTSQKASASGGYGKARIASFVGILPVDSQRRYVVFAAIDEPKGKEAYGSNVAAPVVQEVMKAAILIEGIPSSKQPAKAKPVEGKSD